MVDMTIAVKGETYWLWIGYIRTL